ncbi:hypothetical protein D6D20_02997 [Aureobasidium pullulans]|uniref:Uncharacterized protein n=1 Tax=Aureobasidium pullulans TaxID=5580 RepID=A0A4S8ZDD8_AURPU|nr:hypothetical protein D6D20_02997 [Aureobasidium pullulans]TIA03373.1 hypothetical protein D6C82_01899 [Aureobasidium pullulans]
MCAHIDLGNLRLSCPSTRLDLVLTSNASFSTLARRSFQDTISATNIESACVWIAPATNVHLLLNITCPSFASGQYIDILKHRLLTALRHAALWTQLNLQPSLSVEPSLHPDTGHLIIISLTSAPPPSTGKKVPTHRLGKDVPFSHLKPPEGVPHWTLDQVNLGLDIRSPIQPMTADQDCMLFESPTPLDQGDDASFPTNGGPKFESIVTLIDAALRLVITNLPPKALSGMKITERSSFKHLGDICPAMWSPGHLEAVASRTIFLPTISHAISDSVQQRARSFSLREKLKEVARQETTTTTSNSPTTIQKAVSIRLWRLMQRRLRDPSAGKGLKSIQISDETLSMSGPDHEYENTSGDLCQDLADDLEEMLHLDTADEEMVEVEDYDLLHAL